MPDVQSGQRVTAKSFQLRNLHVDPSIGVVTGPSGSARLEPRVLEVLEALARRPGELVTRSELLADIWPGGDVYDEALTQCVYQLRQQLVSAGGDSCRDLITTVPKRGYLLNGEVRSVEAQPEDAVALPAPSNKRRWLAVALAALAALGALWGVFAWRSGTDAGTVQPDVKTLAVLPFLPLMEENREPTLELGMADTLIARLSGIRQLIVRPVTSVRQYGGMDRDALRAGRELGVDAVVEGSIHRSGEALRVTARLLRVADGEALWADSFNEEFSDIFAVQDAICERIVAAVAPELGQEAGANLAPGGTANSEAYDRYLKGRFHLARLTPADLRKSIGHFRAAVGLDPVYAEAWLGLANAQFRLPIAGEAPPAEYYPEARRAAEKALELDPSMAEGYAMLGWIAHWYDWDWAASEAWFRRAIELDSNDTESHLGLAHLLSNTNRHAQALAEVRRARELSPFYLAAAALEGGFLLRAGQPEEALRRLEQARQLDPDFWLVRITLSGAYLAAGRPEDGLDEVRAARQVSGGSTWAMANEVFFLVSLDRAAEAEALVGELRERAGERYVPPYDMAVAYEAVGDLDSAMAALERAYEVRDPKMTFLGVRGWESIRNRPEYADLMRRMNLAGFFE